MILETIKSWLKEIIKKLTENILEKILGTIAVFISGLIIKYWEWVKENPILTIAMIEFFVILTIMFILFRKINKIKSLEKEIKELKNPNVKSKPTNEIKYEPLHDPRDGRTYKIVRIGKQIWMAEDLKYKSNSDDYVKTYPWRQTEEACLEGWHLPTYEEWMELVEFAGGIGLAGKKLKAKNGWGHAGFCNGTDDFGFKALPRDNNNFCWRIWGASKNDSEALSITIKSDNSIETKIIQKSSALPIRCVKD